MTPNQLKEARSNLGLTQPQFAELVGVTKDHVSKMERGTVRITETMAKLVELLSKGTRI